MIDTLMCLTPGPLGKGMTQRQAAKHLDVSTKAIEGTIRRFRERFPDAYERYESIRRAAARHRSALSSPLSFDSMAHRLGEDILETKIKEQL